MKPVSGDSRRLHRSLMKLIQISLDGMILAIAFYGSYLLRFDFVLSKNQFFDLLQQLPFVLIVQFTFLFLPVCIHWYGAILVSGK